MKPYSHAYLNSPDYAVSVSPDGGYVQVARLTPVRLSDLTRYLSPTPLWFWEET